MLPHELQPFPMTPEEIQILGRSREWKHLKGYLTQRVQQEMDRLVRPVTPEDLADHNLRVGKVLAFRELLEYPERNSKK